MRVPGSSLAAVAAIAVMGAGLYARPQTSAAPESTALDRFLGTSEQEPDRHTSRRRLEAENTKFNKRAWLEVEARYASEKGVSHRMLERGGSDIVLRRVLLPALETERAVLSGHRASSALTRANYAFEMLSPTRVRIHARRKEPLLVEGWLTLSADGDLRAIEGSLAKPPSRWVTHVDIVREYARIEGFRVPVRMRSAANVRLAGRSTFSMTYTYLEINGQVVGRGQPSPRDVR